jgi:hypothetical protein
MASFIWRGDTYEYVEKPMLSEMLYVERKFGMLGADMTSSETIVATWFMSIKRKSPGVTWEDVMNSTQEDFQDVPEPEIGEPEPEVPEHEWPMDPTDAGTPTEHPSVSGLPELEPSPTNEIGTFYL